MQETEKSGSATMTHTTALLPQTKNEKFENEKNEYLEIVSTKKYPCRELKQFRAWLDSATTPEECLECEKEAERREEEKRTERYFGFASFWAAELDRAVNKKDGFERICQSALNKEMVEN